MLRLCVYFSFIAAVLMLSSACETVEDVLPKELTNSFSATIGTTAFSSTATTANRNDVDNPLDPSNPYQSVVIAGVALNSQDVITLSIIRPEVPTAGQYSEEGICFDLDCVFFAYGVTVDGDNISYSTVEDSTGNLNINVESVEYVEGGVIKGTFSGVLVNAATSETLPVTNGAFEVEFAD